MSTQVSRKRRRSGKFAPSSKKAKTSFLRKGFASQVGTGRVAALRQRVVLTYSSIKTIPAAAASGTQTVNLNSMNDPDRTGIGAQPNGFDQWAAFYNRYIVYRADVEWWYTMLTDNVSAMVGSVPLNGDSSISVENILGNQEGQAQLIHNKSNVVHGKKTIRIWKFTGRTFQDYMGSTQYQAVTNADPSEVIVYHFEVEASASSTGTLYYRITYYAEMFDSKPLAQS